MKLDETARSPRVPPNRPGRGQRHASNRDAPTTSLAGIRILVGAFRRPDVLIRAVLAYLVRRREYLVLGVWLLGLLVQVLLLWLAGQMLDLFLSAVELWLEMVTKHLTILLDET